MPAIRDDDRAERLRRAIRARKEARTGAADVVPRPAGEPPPLAETQRSLWFVHQLDPQSPAYSVASAFRLRGRLDPARLQRAFDAVVARHRLLRSTFEQHRDTVVRVDHPHAATAIEVVRADASGAVATATARARLPFDLERGPLVRLVLVDASPADDVLVLVLHHILADQASLVLLWKELALAYDGQLETAAPPVQYDDYVHWLRQREGVERQAALEYWRRRLDPLPAELRLPFERPVSAGAAARGRLLRRTLTPDTALAVRALAATTAQTPFTVLAFAFGLLLHRYTNGQDVAFATPASLRSHRATAGMLGYFLNPVVVSTRIDEARPVGLAVAEFGRDLRDALAHASLPFQALVEALAPPRHRDRHPIFQAMFVYEEPPPPPAFGQCRLEPVTLDLGASKFDVTLFASLGAHSFEIGVEYRADRFDDASMEAMLGHYEAIVGNLPGDVARSTADVSSFDARELRRLREFSEGQAPAPIEMLLLPQEILGQARRSPASPAVSCDGARHDYAALEREAGAIARALGAAGVTPGDRVGVHLERSTAIVAAVIGSQWAGAAYVPLDPGYPPARNRAVLEDAEVAAVVTTTALGNSLPAGRWRTIAVDRLDHSGDPAWLPVVPSADAPAYLLYTSGSSGRPKGVVVSHENLRASTRARLQVYDEPPERFLLLPSLAFDSSVAGIFWTLATGGMLVVPTEEEARDPRALAALVARERVTTLLCVPSLYAQVLAVAGDRLQGLRVAIVAGESCPSRLVEEHFRLLPGARLFNEYGPTEATVWSTVHEMTREDGTRPVAIGRPIPGVRIDVADALGRPVPAGIPGHAWIAGATVARGYWRQPDLTAERFVTDEAGERRYRTGDQVAWATDGRLLFVGREDEQIKLRGYRIEPGEIEGALVAQAGIDEAAVVARSAGGSAAAAQPVLLVAFVTTKGTADVSGWRRALAERLPAHMIPSRLEILAELPHLPNGKVDRHRLRQIPLEVEDFAKSRAVPTEREQALLSLWEGLLGRAGLQPTDNFFELGGHSLLVVEMVMAIERDFEVRLSAADVFEHPTVEDLARRIGARRAPGAPSYRHLFPIQATGRRMPFVVAVPHFFSGMFAERFRGERPVYGLRGVSLRPEGNFRRWRTMADLGEELVEEVLRRFPGEGCILAGYSFGCTMAFEAARLLEARGLPAHRLYLITPMPLDFYRLGPVSLQLDGLRAPIDQWSAAQALSHYARTNHPFSRRLYARAWRRLGIQNWRRLLCLAGTLRTSAGLPLTPGILHADVRVERFRLHSQYRPGSVRTPTVIFNAAGTATDAAATWRHCFEGPLTVHETPDPHDHQLVDEAREVILRHMTDMGDA